MQKIRIRYTWRRKEDGHRYQTITPLECLEGRGDTPFLGNKKWEMVGRDFFVMHDKDANEIYTNDKFSFDLFEILHEPTPLIGCFVWNYDELRYEINVFDNEEITCLSYTANQTMRNFKLIPFEPCPKCGKELVDSSPNTMLMSYPPQKEVHCSECDYKGFMVI